MFQICFYWNIRFSGVRRLPKSDPTNNKIFSESGCFSELYCFDVEFCSLLYKIIVLYLKLIQCFMFTFMLVVIIRHRVGLKYFTI